MSHTTHPGLDALWLTEAVRLREEQAGPLEDSEAVRQALAQGGSLPRRILTRAHWLGRREGLLDAQRTWRQGSRLALALLLVLALASGAGLAFAALGDGQRPVNVFWALASLLGLHLLTLLGWALGLLAGGEAAGALGRLWLWLSGKLARDARAAHLAPALLVLLGRRRLARWGLGALVHGLWLLGLLTALAMLLGLLATRRYGFVWETTILGSDPFIALTQALGALPALLGFPLPDAELIRASGDAALASEAARHAWAGWLVGVLLVYGVLPRALLGLLCLWRWKRGLAHLDLDAGILDDGQQRRRLLEQLTRYPPARLAIACDPRRSPDRGTLALLGELARCAASTRIWLLQAPPGEALDSDRLGDWHAALERLQLPHGETSPLAWLETGHD